MPDSPSRIAPSEKHMPIGITLEPDAVSDLIQREPWMARGACRDVPTQWFFPELERSVAVARALCAACDVRPECRDFALADPDILGIWGGTTATERERLRATH